MVLRHEGVDRIPAEKGQEGVYSWRGRGAGEVVVNLVLNWEPVCNNWLAFPTLKLYIFTPKTRQGRCGVTNPHAQIILTYLGCGGPICHYPVGSSHIRQDRELNPGLRWEAILDARMCECVDMHVCFCGLYFCMMGYCKMVKWGETNLGCNHQVCSAWK